MFRSRFAERILLALNLKPEVSLAVQLLLVAPLGLAPRQSPIAAFYLMNAPWLAGTWALLNLPLLASAFRAFRMCETEKRNHALEHATIHYLRDLYRNTRRLAGSAAANGFRVAGARSRTDVQAAFERLRTELAGARRIPAVSRHCGSNVVTGQALATTLAAVAALLFLVLHPTPWIAVASLITEVAAFVHYRHHLGNWIQERHFLSLDFARAEIISIDSVRRSWWEQAPCFFVRTRVQ